MSRRQCSPTFRPALALIGAADGNRPFPSMPTTAMVQHIGERKRGQQLSAPTQSDRAMARTGRSREGQTAPKIPSNKGLHLPSAPVQSANSSIQGSQRLRCSQQIVASDRPFRAGILKPAIPERAKRSSLRQLAVSPNSRAEPKNHNRRTLMDQPET